MTNLTHECPKCNATGKVQWRHIVNGVCFLCNGGGMVTKATCSGYLASQVRGDFNNVVPAAPVKVNPDAPIRVTKEIKGLGLCDVTVYRGEDRGLFRFEWTYDDDSFYGGHAGCSQGWIYVRVQNGTVRFELNEDGDPLASNGAVHFGVDLALKYLQRAHKRHGCK